MIDFVMSENSMGFHAPQEAMRILGDAINLCRLGQLSLHGGPHQSDPARDRGGGCAALTPLIAVGRAQRPRSPADRIVFPTGAARSRAHGMANSVGGRAVGGDCIVGIACGNNPRMQSDAVARQARRISRTIEAFMMLGDDGPTSWKQGIGSRICIEP